LSILRLWLDKANGLNCILFRRIKEKLSGFEPEDLALASGLDLSSVKAAVIYWLLRNPGSLFLASVYMRSES
jgi:hypothetical protein